MKNKKNLLIGALLIAIVAMGVGYAALAQQLTINGSANFADAKWNIAFSEITKDDNLTVGATEVTAPAIVGTSASFDVKLGYPGAKAVYKLKVKNAGTIHAVLKSIAGVTEANNEQPTAIQYKVEGVAIGDTLTASAEQEVLVTVEWVSSESGDTIPADHNAKTATIYLNYEQAK